VSAGKIIAQISKKARPKFAIIPKLALHFSTLPKGHILSGQSQAKDYEIFPTLGPASRTRPIWQELVEAGANGFRLNTSHLTLEQLEEWLTGLVPFLADLSPRLPLVLDLQGSKWRLGSLPAIELHPGDRVELVYASRTPQESGGLPLLPVPHLDFFQAAPQSSPELVLNDARVRLQVEKAGETSILARVTQGGEISAHKGITFSDTSYRKESLTEKDRSIVEMTRSLPGLRYALSYLKDGEEMERYRSQLGSDVYLAAKLERPQALEQAARIALSANEIWLCRGDLGAELGLAEMAAAVASFNLFVPVCPVPVFMAGQVLEHLTGQPNPTRSEVCYLYDSLQRGYRGFVLSDETAIGSYPVESVRSAALFRQPIGRP
jgi:pyruvate kinase